ncbi:MAG TPA: four helix bundle protein [Planctomycetota bacterium]|jgi:four helix bundle protein
MARPNFENLQVYKLAERLADMVWELVLTWNPFARSTVGGQLVEAADSVGANIAEGAGRGAFADNRRFVRIARGSLNETQHFLRRAYRRKLLTEAQIAQLKPVIDELGPRLNGYLRSIGPQKTSVPVTVLARSATQNNGQRTTDNGQLTKHG